MRVRPILPSGAPVLRRPRPQPWAGRPRGVYRLAGDTTSAALAVAAAHRLQSPRSYCTPVRR